ncbi:pentatricopeptide repeat-containing protein At2g15630, mitochondrial-like [Carica papaya]|uniref:pentatricopeptide repeat-containing protein At2g15630, mitochondrial-like n=1 Tax=Carica papaya TaxID=3649 RepID=UPI000B8C97DE|nr:pentatricopeptide repeat-containing protein At2g15630, mitochondrial-like [Carica papaya]
MSLYQSPFSPSCRQEPRGASNWLENSTHNLRQAEIATVVFCNKMRPHKLLFPQFAKHHKLANLIPISHSLSPVHFSSILQSMKISTENSISPPPAASISHDLLLSSVQSSQWHFIEHLSPNLTPSLISATIFSLLKTPELALEFIAHIKFHTMDIKTHCLAIAVISRLPSPKPTLQLLKETISNDISVGVIFDELTIARNQLGTKSSILFDLLIRGYCELDRADEAIECFYKMKEKAFAPKIETCNSMLSLLSKLNRTESAWVLYAEMFSMGIKSTLYTFNIMINVLCKEGKLNKAKQFIGIMECLGIKPSFVTFNTLVHGYCSRGRVEGARLIINEMKAKGIEPDFYTYGSLISGLCKEGRLEEASTTFEKMKENGLSPNAVMYNILIDGYCNKGNLELAFHYKDEMVKKDTMPTVSTYNMLIHALFMESKMDKADGMIKEMKRKE